MVFYIIAMLLWNFCWQINILAGLHAKEINATRVCAFETEITDQGASRAQAIIYCFLTVLVPFACITATYLHLRFVVRKKVRDNKNVRMRKQAEL